jgi:murein DD-endopeptidase MepM/ murein hydrolase activator NlpD
MSQIAPKSFLTLCSVLFSALFSIMFLGQSFAAENKINPDVDLKLNGEFQQGGLLMGTAPTGSKIVYNDKVLRLAEDGTFLFGVGRDAPVSLEITVVYDDDRTENLTYEIAQRQYDIQKVEGVPQRTVTPDPEFLARIRAEAALVRKARTLDDSRMDFEQGFIIPLDGPRTGVYGSQRYYNGVPKNPHYGVDYAGPEGAPVIAPAPGIVTLTHDDMYYSGGTLLIDHGHGLSSTFIHLSKVLVKDGDQIETGDVIAEVGSTGRATGPHLDWRMNWFGVRLDPELVLKAFPANNP